MDRPEPQRFSTHPTLQHPPSPTTMASTMRLLPRSLIRASNRSISRPLPTVTIPHSRPQPQQPAKTTLPSSRRLFSSTPQPNKPKTMAQIKARNTTGPFSWKAGMLFVLTGAGLLLYFRVEKERLERKRVTEMSKGVGKPRVGGPFTLRDLDGNVVTEEALKGKYSFVCPSSSFLSSGWDMRYEI